MWYNILLMTGTQWLSIGIYCCQQCWILLIALQVVLVRINSLPSPKISIQFQGNKLVGISKLSKRCKLKVYRWCPFKCPLESDFTRYDDLDGQNRCVFSHGMITCGTVIIKDNSLEEETRTVRDLQIIMRISGFRFAKHSVLIFVSQLEVYNFFIFYGCAVGRCVCNATYTHILYFLTLLLLFHTIPHSYNFVGMTYFVNNLSQILNSNQNEFKFTQSDFRVVYWLTLSMLRTFNQFHRNFEETYVGVWERKKKSTSTNYHSEKLWRTYFSPRSSSPFEKQDKFTCINLVGQMLCHGLWKPNNTLCM